jgi:hypothetical protein
MADHGRSWFVGAIFVMSVATYALAVYIGDVLDFFRWPPRRLGGRGKKARSEDPPNIWRLLWHCGETIFNWLGHIDKENTHSSRPSTGDEKPEEKGQSSQSSKNEQKSMEEGKAIHLSNETIIVEEQTSKKPGFRLPWPRKREG